MCDQFLPWKISMAIRMFSLMQLLALCWFYTGLLSTLVNAGQQSMKTCDQSNSCPKVQEQTVSGRISCCEKEGCNTDILPPPPRNSAYNGKECPACFELANSQCDREELACCMGDQYYCLEIAGTGTTGVTSVFGKIPPTVPVAIRGCVNEALCSSALDGSINIGTLIIDGEASCSQAPNSLNISRSAAPRLFGCLSQALAGLLLQKILV